MGGRGGSLLECIRRLFSRSTLTYGRSVRTRSTPRPFLTSSLSCKGKILGALRVELCSAFGPRYLCRHAVYRNRSTVSWSWLLTTGCWVAPGSDGRAGYETLHARPRTFDCLIMHVLSVSTGDRA